jgi:GntR family transcriptional regulator, transcriptional repressor for pyruvate dehydrogenase complex
MQFQSIDRRSVAQQVADQLREAVIGAVLRSSQLPTEAQLSQALTVSRPTLREALRILEAEGLVQRDRRTSALRPDTGAAAMSRPLRSALHVLTRTERLSLAEILDLRLTIEARAAERAAEVATPDDLSDLLAALEAIREPRLSGQSWNERTFAFHATMVKAAHNEAFLLIVLATREATADILEGAAQSAVTSGATVATGATAGGAQPGTPVDPKWLDDEYNVCREIYEAIHEGRGTDARDQIRSRAFRFVQQLLDDVDHADEGSPAKSSSRARARSRPGSDRRREAEEP